MLPEAPSPPCVSSHMEFINYIAASVLLYSPHFRFLLLHRYDVHLQPILLSRLHLVRSLPPLCYYIYIPHLCFVLRPPSSPQEGSGNAKRWLHVLLPLFAKQFSQSIDIWCLKRVKGTRSKTGAGRSSGVLLLMPYESLLIHYLHLIHPTRQLTLQALEYIFVETLGRRGCNFDHFNRFGFTHNKQTFSGKKSKYTMERMRGINKADNQ